MEKVYLVFLIFFDVILVIFLNGCNWKTIDELNRVTEPLNYKQMVGTYLFIPKDYEAQKLKISKGDSVILEITADSLEIINNGEFIHGKYTINKMILIISSNSSNKFYKGQWVFFSHKDPVRKDVYMNNILFHQKLMNGNNISFNIEKRLSDTLHIVGYTTDPKYEVIKVIDFKKIK